MAYRPPEPLAKHHRCDDFESGEPALDEWLKRYALQALASDSARVYVSTVDAEPEVVGYYALAAAEVAPDEATARALKGQAARPVPAVLLARLAVDLAHQGAGLGRSLLQDAMLRCVDAADTIGARVLLVHAKHDEAREWYLRFGFEESPTDPLHLILLLKDIRKAVG